MTDHHAELTGLDLAACMHAGLPEAEAAGRAGELPIGAVLVIDGEIVLTGRAGHQRTRSQLMDAELQALLGGGEALWKRYERAVLFTTVEPCPMCLGAAVMADVPHIVFASHDAVAGCRQVVESVPYVRRQIRTYLGGVLEAEARMLMGRFEPRWLEYVQSGQ